MHYQTKEEIIFFVKLFEEKRLPAKDWTHPAHLMVATVYCNKYGEAAALNRIRTNIKQFNIFHGGKNTETEGYHETITVWYMQQVEKILRELPSNKSLKEKIDAVLASELTNTRYVYEFYSKEKLMSKEGRLGYIAPDLQV